MENRIIKEMEEALIKHFLDTIVLTKLRDTNPLSGYDTIGFIHERFDVLVSSGTVYSLLYSLERKGLVKAEWTEGKRLYVLTEKGKATVDAILRSKEEILSFIRTILEG
jgi:DNA-binding PadR family transcriptional regulator